MITGQIRNGRLPVSVHMAQSSGLPEPSSSIMFRGTVHSPVHSVGLGYTDWTQPGSGFGRPNHQERNWNLQTCSSWGPGRVSATGKMYLGVTGAVFHGGVILLFTWGLGSLEA